MTQTSTDKSEGTDGADKVAAFGGSWTFIIIFAIILFGWMGVNAGFLLRKPFDPFPYIFLNLILSCLAAIQAPVIMMSQNRQEAKDRMLRRITTAAGNHRDLKRCLGGRLRDEGFQPIRPLAGFRRKRRRGLVRGVERPRPGAGSGQHHRILADHPGEIRVH